jgi:protein TonB
LREEGVVILRITVNVSGRPTNVVIVKSSGYPRLDRAALEGGWRCHIRNAADGDQFDAPLRFNLQK